MSTSLDSRKSESDVFLLQVDSKIKEEQFILMVGLADENYDKHGDKKHTLSTSGGSGALYWHQKYAYNYFSALGFGSKFQKFVSLLVWKS